MYELPKAILFDADGTLYDSEQLHFEATRQAIARLHDFDLTWDLYVEHMMEGSKSGDEMLRAIGFETDTDAYQAHKLNFYSLLAAEKLVLAPGLLDFLKWCRQQNIERAIVTTTRLRYIETSTEKTSIRDFFDIVVSNEDVSAEQRKPHPLPYELALRLTGVKKHQALVVEDTAKGIKSAQAAGLRCVGILNSTNSRAKLAKADLIIEHYDELREYLTST